MSNTSLVEPIEAVCTGIVALPLVLGVGAVMGTASLARWLTAETEADTAVSAQLRELRREDRLPRRMNPTPTNVMTLNLHLRDTQSLVRTAERLGYRPIHPPDKSTPTLMHHPTGGRIAISQNAKGRTALYATQNLSSAKALIRRHTVEAAIAHLRNQGMRLTTTVEANGEVQILASEPEATQSDGAAEVEVRVNASGSGWVDVQRITGTRCDDIVSGLAEAIGGDVSHSRRKPSYFQRHAQKHRRREESTCRVEI